jgi:polar amino acid transport system substrate-binding protein
MWRQRFIVRITAALILIAAGLTTSAGSIADERLTFATINYPPYSFAEEDLISGITPAIVRSAAERAGLEIDIIIVPARRALALTESGIFDAVFSLIWTPERAEMFDYGQSAVVNEEIILVTRADSDHVYGGNLDALSGTRVGAVSGFSLGSVLDEAFASGLLVKEENSSNHANMRMLLKGRVDVAASDKLSALSIMGTAENLSKFRILVPVIESTPTFMAFTKVRDMSVARNKLDKALMEMKNSGLIDSIIKRQLTSHR